MKKEIKYLLILCIITFLTWGVLVITQIDSKNPFYTLLTFAGALSPAIAGIIVSKDKKKLFKNILDYKNKKVLLILFIVIPFVMIIIGNLFFSNKEAIITQIIMIPIYLIVTIIGGGLEEIGWRGVLQKELQQKWKTPIYTLVIGFIWLFWHLPMWFINESIQAEMSFLLFSVNILITNILFVYIYKKTDSLFILIMLHALINTFSTMYMLS